MSGSVCIFVFVLLCLAIMGKLYQFTPARIWRRFMKWFWEWTGKLPEVTRGRGSINYWLGCTCSYRRGGHSSLLLCISYSWILVLPLRRGPSMSCCCLNAGATLLVSLHRENHGAAGLLDCSCCGNPVIFLSIAPVFLPTSGLSAKCME